MTPLQKKGGFTLIEILLALLVITIGVVAITGVLGSSLDATAKTHSDLDAVCFADLVLNYCQAADFDAIPTSGSLSLPDHEQSDVSLSLGAVAQFPGRLPRSTITFGGQAQEYTVTYRLDIVADGNVKAVTLQVWPGFSANGTSRTFYTELYNWDRL
ncbi:hypothetical protein PDESU_00624 [Pontiella desulfatans]|uniref:Prepilin-type N-terminal cleavage/methylation domain-containing protein n=1 Tax=Pontiella desulfatans TaxID=2750659 RepID=A0A6C2TX24_PONDE|nr:prepilin-type N-terminal cleavage/methylation domain-containing protein [Pontiella desulfatans]VGO12074.1 hypothetical protein PDESU_00624 [Pontiella desulfatans]